MAPIDPPPPARDDVLITRLRHGEADALRELMGRYYARLVTFASTYLDSQDTAEDAVQAVFIALWDRRAELPEGSNFMPYLYSAVRRRAISGYRADRTRQRYHEAVTRDPARDNVRTDDDMLARVELDELAMQLDREIAELPPRCQEIFRLSREQGLSYGEIATLLGISPHTVRVQIAKALSLLRRDLHGWIA